MCPAIPRPATLSTVRRACVYLAITSRLSQANSNVVHPSSRSHFSIALTVGPSSPVASSLGGGLEGFF